MAKGCAIFETATSYARLSSSLPSNGTWTFGAWFYIESRAAGTNETFFYLNGSAAGLRMSSSDTLRLSGPGVDVTTSAQPAQGAWIYLAVSSQNNGNTVSYQYNASYTQQAAYTHATALTGTGTTLTVGANESGTSGFEGNLRVSQARLWSTALNQSQIEAELASVTPVVTASLLESFENDPANDGWTTAGTVTVSTAYFPPNYPAGGQPTGSRYRAIPGMNQISSRFGRGW